jgi:hypothetical protein
MKLNALDIKQMPGEEWLEAITRQVETLIARLSVEERSLIPQIWKHIATYNTPAAARKLVNRQATHDQQVITGLSERKLLWFDNDLQAVLQCPPFSALHTPHEIKVFGWERTHASSFIDLPGVLLVYGPNVWLDTRSTCPRSGEKMQFRLRAGADGALDYEAPPEASGWRVWLPMPGDMAGEAYQQFHSLRSKINLFFTQDDLDTHRHYQSESSGMVYTFEQALYLGMILARTYRRILPS